MRKIYFLINNNNYFYLKKGYFQFEKYTIQSPKIVFKKLIFLFLLSFEEH